MKSFSLFGPDAADEIIGRRKNRAVIVEAGGEFYGTRTIMDTPDVLMAELLAEDYEVIATAAKEGLRGALLRRKQDKLAKALIETAHQEVDGNLGLFSIDVSSGLLEPGGIDSQLDRFILAGNLARDILANNIETLNT